ncbi:MAG: hypothetical protein HY769_10775 [Candidatus Stahlbacteria bacterium]|nr:hypothetical protein [Candidatus Stahlbacteria bacterium]
MGARDYMPTTDAGFDAFQATFINKVQPKLGAWSIPVAEFNQLLNFQLDWGVAWAKARDKDTRSRADVQQKKGARKAYVAGLRKFAKSWIMYNDKVTDAEREGLGLKVKDIEPTPMPVPAYAPDITIDTIRHLLHKIRLTDPLNPHTQEKPKGVREIEVFRFLGDTAPTNISAYEFVGNATKFLYEVRFEMADVGKKVFYVARYVNTRGIPGPWSIVVNAAVA